jgi:hypothetical protein
MRVRDREPTAGDGQGGGEGPPLRIFLNYRREDSSGYAGRLYDDLAERLTSCDVFIDIDKIEPGADFVDVIDRALDGCDVVLAVMGKQWLSISDSKGRRRLDDPDDYVRLELEAALARGMRLIPVRVQGAEMPSSADLPESLRSLARRQAVEISDHRWRYDVDTLTSKLEQISAEAEERTRAEAARLAEEEAASLRAAAEAQAVRDRDERERARQEAAAQERAKQVAERERRERERAEAERRRVLAKEQERAEKESLRRERSATRGEATSDRRRRTLALLVVAGAVAAAAVAIVELRDDADPDPPVSTSAPELAGARAPRVGQTLTVVRGSWDGSPTGFAFRWQRCNPSGRVCAPVAGADTDKYRLGKDDVGRRIRASVVASNAGGSTRATTKPTAVIPAVVVPVSSTRPPRIRGGAQEGSTLRVVPGAWAGTKPIERTHAWLRCDTRGSSCARIAGEAGRSYVLRSRDVEHTIRVVERAANVAGRRDARSPATAVVRGQPAPPPTTTTTESPPTTTEPEPCPPNCPTFP